MRGLLALFSIIIAFLALPGLAASARVEELFIESAGARHRFTVEMATTPRQQERGLMNRTEMAADHGMLFLMPYERPMGMWMKNTPLPLDMLFIDARGAIRHIQHRALPGSLDIVEHSEPVLAVLELLGGTAAKLGITEGDRVIHPAFAP